MSASRQIIELRNFLQQPGGQPLAGRASGFSELDQALPWGGWPRGALTEILVPAPASGELALLLPVLKSGWNALVGPPCIPYAPALRDRGLWLDRLWLVHERNLKQRLWTFEELAKNGAFASVVAWQLPLSQGQSRRLQLAAEAGNSCVFLVRPAHCREQASNAAARIQLTADQAGLQLDIFKCRGRVRGQQISIPRQALRP